MTNATHRVKEELARFKPSRLCCQTAELSTLLHMDGTYVIRGGERHCFVTESAGAPTARKIYSYIHLLFPVKTSVVRVHRSSPRKDSVYRLEIPEQPGFHQLLNELGVLDDSLSLQRTIPVRLFRNECCAASVMRGAFLGGGYISDPFGRADFEIVFSSEALALSVGKAFARRSLEPLLRTRRNQHVIYVKKRQQISDFLAVAGAHGTHLEWESQTILNATKNQVNRIVNCDTANARRLAEASLKQQEAIEALCRAAILSGLEASLVELAEARMANPQASMSELGRLLDPPVGKSTVQRRMRRLLSLLPEGPTPG